MRSVVDKSPASMQLSFYIAYPEAISRNGRRDNDIHSAVDRTGRA